MSSTDWNQHLNRVIAMRKSNENNLKNNLKMGDHCNRGISPYQDLKPSIIYHFIVFIFIKSNLNISGIARILNQNLKIYFYLLCSKITNQSYQAEVVQITPKPPTKPKPKTSLKNPPQKKPVEPNFEKKRK